MFGVVHCECISSLVTSSLQSGHIWTWSTTWQPVGVDVGPVACPRKTRKCSVLGHIRCYAQHQSLMVRRLLNQNPKLHNQMMMTFLSLH